MADIRLPLNVMTMTAAVGSIAMISAAGPANTTVMLVAGSVATLTQGLPVKLVTGAGNIPQVEIAVPGTDSIYGLVIFNPKYASHVATDIFQVTCAGAVMNLTSSGSLSRGAQVGLDPTTYKLIAATKANFIGTLLDDATTNAIVRVELSIPLNASLALS